MKSLVEALGPGTETVQLCYVTFSSGLKQSLREGEGRLKRLMTKKSRDSKNYIKKNCWGGFFSGGGASKLCGELQRHIFLESSPMLGWAFW